MRQQPQDPSELLWLDLAVPRLGLTVQVPEGWVQVDQPRFALQVQAPEEDGYRLTVSYDDTSLDPPTEATFQAMAETVARTQATTYEGYEELHRSMVGVGGRAGVAIHYRWHPEALGRDIEGLWVAVPVATDRAVLIDAAAAAGGDDPLAAARWVITSTRFGEGPAGPASSRSGGELRDEGGGIHRPHP